MGSVNELAVISITKVLSKLVNAEMVQAKHYTLHFNGVAPHLFIEIWWESVVDLLIEIEHIKLVIVGGYVRLTMQRLSNQMRAVNAIINLSFIFSDIEILTFF